VTSSTDRKARRVRRASGWQDAYMIQNLGGEARITCERTLQAMGKKCISRREFLVSTAAGIVIPGVAYSASRPCPPSNLTVTGGTTAITNCSRSGPGQLPRLVLVSRAADGAHAWTFGHAFREGDVPSGSSLTADGDVIQVDVRNRWPDGSLKFAVLSGITTLLRNSPKPVVLAVKSGVDRSATASVSEPTSLDVSVTFSGGVAGTYTLQSALGVSKENWGGRSGAGRVRRILGPLMSEFHYFVPTSDEHVTVWFYVRRYANGATEVETVVENGWLFVAAPGQRDYSVSLTVAGMTRYSGSMAHFHHARWSRVDWVGQDPQIVPRHDPSYLRQTKLVPNYGYTAPTDAAFSGLATELNPQPFAQGNWPDQMGTSGASPSIGLLPKWEALYCTSADERAYTAMLSNSRAAGRYSIHYRDESTGRPPLYAPYPNLTLTSGWGTQRPPAPAGGRVYWTLTHHPSVGYLAYIATGRWPFLESLMFSASYALLETKPEHRQGGGVLACINAPLTTRGSAWTWRTVGQAAAIAPTSLGGTAAPAADIALQNQTAKSIDDTAVWMRRRYVDGTIDGGVHRNSIGWLGQYDRYDKPAAPTEWWGSAWMVRFQSLALGHISDLGIENLARKDDLETVRNHSYEGALQLIGDDSTWNWRRLALYGRPYLKNSSVPASPVFMSTEEAFAAYRSYYQLSPLPAAPGGTLKAHSSDVDSVAGDSSDMATGYGSYVAAVLAMAVDHGRPGAVAKYALIRSAANFDPIRGGANNNPTWAIVPR